MHSIIHDPDSEIRRDVRHTPILDRVKFKRR